MLGRRSFIASAAGAALAATAARAAEAGTLEAIARRRGLRFGTAASFDQLKRADSRALIARECGVLTAENEFKWKHLERIEGKYRETEADDFYRFAADEGMQLRGHTFVWSQDNRIPDWMLAKEADLARDGGKPLVALMQRHCDYLAKRYPTIPSWDAVNEVVQLQDGALRSSLFLRVLGERFIDIAFAMMREALPKCQMVYNDYMSWDAKADHRDGVLRMLEGALGRGVKIDALGIQSHIGGTLGRKRDELAWRKFLEAVQGMGLDVLITELDCSDRNVAATEPAVRDAEVAAFTKGYLDLTLSFTNVRQVVTWSLTDFDSYLNRPGYPGERRRPDGLAMRGHPSDAEMRPKPLRTAIAEALAAAPVRKA
jgi:endo-1,4-beta-xylanase